MSDIMVPIISILIPIYNAEPYLHECLDSVCNQTFESFEAVCINDGSTDSSREIILEYVQNDPRFRLIDKPNSGYGASMNRGLSEATAEYIAILESDDFYEPDMLEKLHEAIREHDAQVARANCYYYWSPPNEVNRLSELVPMHQTGRLINPSVDHDIFFLSPAVWSALYRRNFLIENNIDFLETPGASYQDTAFAFKVWVCANRVIFIPQALLHYRQDNSGSSVNSPGKVYCVADEHAEMDRFLELRDTPKWLRNVKARMKCNTYLWNYWRLSDSLRIEFLQYMSDDIKKELDNGWLDWRLFTAQERLNFGMILRSPEEFHSLQSKGSLQRLATKTLACLRIGGFSLLLSTVKERLSEK